MPPRDVDALERQAWSSVDAVGRFAGTPLETDLLHEARANPRSFHYARVHALNDDYVGLIS